MDKIATLDDIREYLGVYGKKGKLTLQGIMGYISGTFTFTEAFSDYAGRIYDNLPDNGKIYLPSKEILIVICDKDQGEYFAVEYDMEMGDLVKVDDTSYRLDDFKSRTGIERKIFSEVKSGDVVEDRKRTTANFLEALLNVSDLDEIKASVVEISEITKIGPMRFFGYKKYVER